MNTAGLGIAAVMGVVVGVLLAVEKWSTGRGRGRRPQGARWASGRDLRDLRVDGPGPGRLILGRHGRHLVAAEPRSSVIVFAPTETNKTVGLAIPALLEWEGPVVAASAKSDLLFDTLARRRQLGRAMIFDPTGATGQPPIHATPLSGCGSWRGAMRVAHWLVSSARTGAGGFEDAEFWYAAAEKLLAPLLYAAASSGGEMADVIRWLNEGRGAKQEVSKALVKAKEADALSAWRASCHRDERQRSSIYTTAETIVAAFADPRVLEATAYAEYTPADLIDDNANTLYLCAPTDEQERLRTLFAMMIRELVAVVYELAAHTGKPIKRPILVVIDEAANIAPVPNLDQIASTGAGQGIKLLTIFQDLAQVNACYGQRARTILNNHRAKLFGTGISDPDTLTYISQVVGPAEFSQLSRTAGRQGHNTTTEATAYRDLTPPSVVREADPRSALLIYGHRPPAKLAWRPWFEEESLKKLARAEGEQGEPNGRSD